MELLPILRTLGRNKLGAALIALQIAVTLAIISNSLSMIQQRVRWMDRPTGIDEAQRALKPVCYLLRALSLRIGQIEHAEDHLLGCQVSQHSEVDAWLR